jgi:hypothetical protein
MTMSKYTIAIPHLLYEKAQRLAQQTSQSVDEIICTRLTVLRADRSLSASCYQRSFYAILAYHFA